MPSLIIILRAFGVNGWANHSHGYCTTPHCNTLTIVAFSIIIALMAGVFGLAVYEYYSDEE